jgi:hypothetical protein
MARTFNGSSDFLLIASTLGISDAPMSMSCQFINANDSALLNMVSLSDGSNDAHALDYRGDTADNLLRAYSNDSGVATGAASSVPNSGVAGYIVVGTWTSTSSRRIHYRSIGTGTHTDSPSNTTLVTPDAMSEWNIGRYSASIGRYANGVMSHVGIWNVALDAGEALSLTRGFPPRRVRPQSLVAYFPLIRNLFDWKGNAITSSGTTEGVTRAYGF